MVIKNFFKKLQKITLVGTLHSCFKRSFNKIKKTRFNLHSREANDNRCVCLFVCIGRSISLETEVIYLPYFVSIFKIHTMLLLYDIKTRPFLREALGFIIELSLFHCRCFMVWSLGQKKERQKKTKKKLDQEINSWKYLLRGWKLKVKVEESGKEVLKNRKKLD